MIKLDLEKHRTGYGFENKKFKMVYCSNPDSYGKSFENFDHYSPLWYGYGQIDFAHGSFISSKVKDIFIINNTVKTEVEVHTKNTIYKFISK